MKVLFMGRKSYSAALLKWTIDQGHVVEAVVTDSHFANSPTAQMARQLNIDILDLEQAEEKIKENPEWVDLVVSYLFWRKIKEPLISSPRLGCINFHPAILPDWRGTAGYNIAILNKLPQWGVTAHYVDATIDTGSIIEVRKFDFDYTKDTAQSLERKTQLIQMDLYKDILNAIEKNGRLPFVEQCVEDGIYISRNQMEEMKRVDFEKDDIDLKIRAFWFPPYDGAFVEIDGKRYTLVNRDLLQTMQQIDETADGPRA